MVKWVADEGVGTAVLREGFEAGADESRRELRDDGVSIAAQEARAAGKPSNQRANSGFKTPGFAVGAGDDAEVGPCAI
jgi:hypothetical protein